MDIGDRTTTVGRTAIRTPDQRVRVFISSTLGELAAERLAARASVEQLRMTPILFELGARPHPPTALYRSYLAQSDVFVGIYWQRYGWVAPGMEISGLEDELQLAAEMPRLIYVKRPAPDMDPRLTEMLRGIQGEQGSSYKPFRDAAELHELLLDDLALLLTERFRPVNARGAAESGPSRLPAPTSTFVGRRAELERLHGLLADDAFRLVTLAGPAGTGKTRLAIEVARSLTEQFKDGVFFVNLTEQRQPDDAFATVARTLDVSDAADQPPLEQLKLHLAWRQAFLVLDNLEQVTAAGPGLVELLTHCPAVKLLVTSRETLRVSAEHVFRVPVLSLPPDGVDVSLDEVLRSEAGRLFVDRASGVGSGFAPTDADAADLAAICHRLDGLPLALELAAAAVKLFSLGELREGLDRRFDLLTGADRDRPARQRTLRDAIEWSEELLTDDDRTVFRLMSVFSDGRLRDLDETFHDLPELARIDVVEALSSLVDKSLVRVTPGSDRRPRFSMLQTIRDYAAEQAAGSPELVASMRQAHAAHFARVAVELHRPLTRADRATALEALGDELGNLRAAWQYSVERRDVARLDDLLAPLWGYFEARGDYRAVITLGEDLLRTLASFPESPERLHHELTLRANLARTQLVVHGFSPAAERVMVETLDRLTASREAAKRFPTLRSLASLYLWRADFEHAAATARELMAVAEQQREPGLLAEAHLTTCLSDSWLRDLAAAIDDADRAAEYSEGATSGSADFRIGPNPGVVAHAIGALLKWTAGCPDAATVSMRQALDLADDLAHPYSQAFALHHATLLDLWREDLPSVEARAEESKRLADSHDYGIWQALALVLHGAATVAVGQPDIGLPEMEQGFSQYRELVTPPIFWPALLVIRATAHATAGDVNTALKHIDEATADLGNNHPAAAEIAIAHGDILLMTATPDVGAATALFQRATSLSAHRGARMLELQALTRLARIHPPGRSRDEALRRLRELHRAFTEGITTPPLQAAAAVLAGDS